MPTMRRSLFGLLVLLLAVCSTLAATQQQAAGEIDCVNGRVYRDSPDMGRRCECWECWQRDRSTGQCTVYAGDSCRLPLHTNQAFLIEEFWARAANNQPVLTLDSVYRTAYQEPEVWPPLGDKDYELPTKPVSSGVAPVNEVDEVEHLFTNHPLAGIAPALGSKLRAFHRHFRNAPASMIDKATLVVAHGGTQLFQAAFYAYAKIRGRPQVVTAAAPFYYLLPWFAAINPGTSSWEPNPDVEAAGLPENLIELVVTPNNPTGMAELRRFSGSTIIQDSVFKWPSYTDDWEAGPEDEQADVLLFSLSKLTGHSGSRLGWAFVRDPKVAELMGEYIYYSTHGTTVDAQARCLQLLDWLLKQESAAALKSTLSSPELHQKLAAAEAEGTVFLEAPQQQQQGQLPQQDTGLAVAPAPAALNQTNSLTMFNYVRTNLQRRWDLILPLFAQTNRFRVESQSGFCLLWVRCNGNPSTHSAVEEAALSSPEPVQPAEPQEAEADAGDGDAEANKSDFMLGVVTREVAQDQRDGGACSAIFSQAGLQGRDGLEFGLPGSVRLNMMVHEVTFQLMYKRLQQFILQEL